MSWIKIAGKSLEFSGKIIQSASFEEWAESRGRQIVEQFAEKRTISLFSKWAARKELLSDLNNMAHQPALHTSLSVLAARYLTTIAEVSNSFEDNEFSADGKTYIGPRFSVNTVHRAILERILSPSDEFNKLKGGPLLQSFFYDEFVEQLDGAFAQMQPRSGHPVELADKWYVVKINTDYDWRVNEKWNGHFFVHGSTSDLLDKSNLKKREAKINSQIDTLENQLGLFSLQQKQRIATPWVQARDNIVAEQSVRDVPSLLSSD